MARRYEDALEQFRRTLELDRYAVSAYSWLALAYERLDRPDDAIEAYVTPLTFSEENRDLVAALQRGGQTRRHERILAAPASIPPRRA